MTDSRTERTDENRFSKALLGRVIAVGLFVALGTGAVIFMMGKDKKELGLSTDSEQKPIIETAAPPNTLGSQVQASFSNELAQNPKTGQASFNPNVPDFAKSQPTTLPPSPKPTSFSNNQSPPQNGSIASTDRFAALDRPGNPLPISAEIPKQESPIKIPDTKPVSPDPFGKFPTTNPNQPGFAPNPSSLRSADKPASEALKPFAMPDPPSRMNAPGDNAPNLQAPIPRIEKDLNATASSMPKVANNPFDRIGNPEQAPSNVLKPFNPSIDPLANKRENENQSNSEPFFEKEQPSADPNRNQPDFNNRSRDLTTPRDSAGSSNPPTNPNPTTQPGSLPGRPISRPVSAPISSGSPINQPQSDPLKPAPASSLPRNIEARTANVPGDRTLDGVQAPALIVEKLSPKEVTVNEVADFVIVIRNVGRVVANDVFVHDQVPANTEFQGSNPPPQYSVNSDRKLQWQVGTLAPGQEQRIQYQLKPTTPGEIGSVAHVTFSTQASMRTKVTNPILEIVHRAKPVAMIGSDVIFDVMISNKGDGPAKDVLIQEDVPPQLQYQEGFRELEYEVGTLMPGQSKRLRLGLKAIAVGQLKNVVVASAAGGQRVQHALDMEVVAPKLAIQADGPTKRYLGRNVAHQFRIANQGTASSTNVDLVAKLPAGLRFMEANNRGVYRQATHSVHWSLSELTTTGSESVEMLTMPIAEGTQDIKFEATADLNQTATVTHPLNIEHLVDIFFDIDDLVDPIEIGADTAYQLKIANQGTQLSNNIQLQVEFPNGITPTSVEGNLQNQIAGQRVQFAPINNLKPGEQLTVIVRAKGQAPGDHRVVATMQADGRNSAVTKEEISRVYADR